MTVGHFISRLFEGTLHVDEIHMPFKMADVTHICTTRSSPPADRFHTETGGRFAFTWYRCEISYWSEILARPSTTTGVNSRRGESHPNDILWWYHVTKCRAMIGNRSELAPARTSPRCHVNTPLSRIALLSTLWKPGTGKWRKWLAHSD